MTPDQLESMVRGLLRDDVYLSPSVPTRRFGIHGLVRVTASKFGPRDTARPPLHWIVVDADSHDLVVFARTKVFSPVPDWVPPTSLQDGDGDGELESIPVREALAELHRLGPSIVSAFFADAPMESSARRRHAAALRSALPAALRPWMHEVCGDFWSWLLRP